MKLMLKLLIIGMLIVVIVSLDNDQMQSVNAQSRLQAPYFKNYEWSLDGCDSGDIVFTGQVVLDDSTIMSRTGQFRISTLALETEIPRYSMGRAHIYFEALAGSRSVRNISIAIEDADDWSFQYPYNPTIRDSVFPYRRSIRNGDDVAYVSIWNMTENGCSSAAIFFSCSTGEVDFQEQNTLCMGGPE